MKVIDFFKFFLIDFGALSNDFFNDFLLLIFIS